jgi:hypothetical protein
VSTFWPDQLNLDDNSPPAEILASAQDEWQTASGGVLGLIVQEGENDDGNIVITVYAKHNHSGRTATLFCVVHRKGKPYPVTIDSTEDKLPSYLMRSYRPFSIANIMAANQVNNEIHNEWVSNTPNEFRVKLKKMFNREAVRSELLNLVSMSGR